MCKADTKGGELSFLQELEERTKNVRSIAIWRLTEYNLAAKFVPNLQRAVEGFLGAHKNEQNKEYLSMLLKYHLKISQLDPTLAEELGRNGSHQAIRKLLQYDTTVLSSEEEQDAVIEIQDVAGEIAATSGSFPLSLSPFTEADLARRLPIMFDLENEERTGKEHESKFDDPSKLLIHQVTARQTAQADVGFVLWPSAVILAHFLRRNSGILTGSILELGAGCGLTGLSVAKILHENWQNYVDIPNRVVLTDFNGTVLDNLRHNVALNDVSAVADVAGLDFYQQKEDMVGWYDMDDNHHDPVDIIIAADVICQASDAVACGRTIFNALKPDGTAYVVCADAEHRFGVDRLAEECRNVGLCVQTRPVADEELGRSDGLQHTAGYIPGMNLTFFTMTKQGDN